MHRIAAMPLSLSLGVLVLGIASFGWSLWAAQTNSIEFVAPAISLFWQMTYLGGPILVLLGACGVGLHVWRRHKRPDASRDLL